MQAAAVCGAGFCLSVEPDERLHGGMYRECTVAPAGGGSGCPASPGQVAGCRQAGADGRGRRVIKIMKENAEHLNNEQENRTGI